MTIGRGSFTRAMDWGRMVERDKWAVVLAFYAGVAVIVMRRVLFQPDAWVLGGYGDTQQFMWYLGWFWHAILHGQNAFYTFQLNAPLGQNILWNTSIFAESILFGWLTPVIGASAIYNYLWLTNFVVACLLGRRILFEFNVKHLPAAVGGLLFGMMPYETSQMLFHLHLWFTTPVLGILLVLIRQFKSGTRPVTCGVLVGILGALEFYTSLETFVTFGFVLLLFWVVARLMIKQPLPVGNRMFWLAGVVTGAVLCAPACYALLVLPGSSQGAVKPFGVYVNDLLTFFIPTPVYSWRAPWMDNLSFHYTGNVWENDGYLGLPALALCAWTAREFKQNKFVMAGVFTLFVIAVLSLGPTLHVGGTVTSVPMPWLFLQYVPPFRDVLPSRLMLYGDIICIVLIAVIWNKALQASTRKKWAAALMVGLVCATWLPELPFYTSHRAFGEEVILNHREITLALENQRVLVLTSDSSIFMQVLADDGYRMQMVNAYGYANNPAERSRTLASFSTAIPGMTEQKIERLLGQDVPGLRAQKIVYFPVSRSDKIPEEWFRALETVCGKPIVDIDGVEVWRISN